MVPFQHRAALLGPASARRGLDASGGKSCARSVDEANLPDARLRVSCAPSAVRIASRFVNGGVAATGFA
jgi:hypothetical protein